MLFLAVGESLKSIEKITGGSLFTRYPDVGWIGAKGFRDVIAHQYFNIDAEEVFGIFGYVHKVRLGADERMSKKQA